MNFQRVRAFLALLAIGSSIDVIAQTPSSGLPLDPMALMSLAHDRNGLIGSDIRAAGHQRVDRFKAASSSGCTAR